MSKKVTIDELERAMNAQVNLSIQTTVKLLLASSGQYSMEEIKLAMKNSGISEGKIESIIKAL